MTTTLILDNKCEEKKKIKRKKNPESLNRNKEKIKRRTSMFKKASKSDYILKGIRIDREKRDNGITRRRKLRRMNYA